MGAWDERFTVRSFDVEQRGRLTPIALFPWMLDAAGRHAAQVDWGIHDLQRRSVTLHRVSVSAQKIAALPGWGDAVTVRTWPSGLAGVFAMRELRALDEGGSPLARAKSAWLLRNHSTRRPLRPGEELASLTAFTPVAAANSPWQPCRGARRVRARRELCRARFGCECQRLPHDPKPRPVGARESARRPAPRGPAALPASWSCAPRCRVATRSPASTNAGRRRRFTGCRDRVRPATRCGREASCDEIARLAAGEDAVC